jgi:hypothetical protein
MDEFHGSGDSLAPTAMNYADIAFLFHPVEFILPDAGLIPKIYVMDYHGSHW